MQPLNVPLANLTIKTDGKNKLVFDITRKKFVVLTPEEWVRQNFLHYLINEKHFPQGLIKTESGIKIYNTKKRTDITVYDKNANPVALVECKAQDVEINQQVFDQIARYNIKLRAKLLIVTNGIKTYNIIYNKEQNKYQFLTETPFYNQIETL